MRLSKHYREQIRDELNSRIVDPWEWCPAINYILEILGFDDEITFDSGTQIIHWGEDNDTRQ